MELKCAVQNYHWGKKGNSSLVGKFAFSNSGIALEDSKPYAEFWMGTHPNGPSLIKSSGVELSCHLTQCPEELGPDVTNVFGNELPFLFKILSIEEPLSIQAHPTKSHAKKLFMEHPEIYKDGNHKPELAIAASKFEALCGFRPLAEIQYFLQNISEFQMLIDSVKIKGLCGCDVDMNESVSFMKECFSSLMMSKDDVVASAIEKLIARMETLNTSEKEEFLVPLVKRIHKLFPKDIGVFCVYWLNYIVLSPGEALFLAPNEPHAYLFGDCFECMANSDNVVRAGLTPKFRDIETLCQMLTYKNYNLSEIVLHPKEEDEFCMMYSPPVNDFAVVRISLPTDKKYNLKRRKSASILLVTEGCGELNSTLLEFGKVLFIPALSEYSVVSNGLVLLQAFCNI